MYDKMKKTVFTYEKEHPDAFESNGIETSEANMILVWGTKILQNWKSCIKSKASLNDLFYELTYNGNTDQLYVDVYKKFDQKRITRTLVNGVDSDTIAISLEDPMLSFRETLFKYVQEHLDKTDDVNFTLDDVYIVWTYRDPNCLAVRAMLSTNLPDGMYYEMSYDFSKNDLRLYAYKKLENYTVDYYNNINGGKK